MRVLIVVFSVVAVFTIAADAREPMPVWPDFAPGETTKFTGEKLPARKGEDPPVTRVVKITQPTFTVHIPEKPNGTSVVILPGGGFGRVVPDLEGTEAADWLNRHGVSAFVVSYRTKGPNDAEGWLKPLQDSQRMVSVVRSRAKAWGLNPDRVGLFGFSAGGQVAARHLSDGSKLAYEPVDQIDEISHQPNFAILVYPWNIYDAKNDRLIDGVKVPANCPPTFLVHTHDDRSSSLGAVLFYADLKRQNIPAALHVYGNGGHGYGTRSRPGSDISTWPDHATTWLASQKLLVISD